MQIVQLEPLRHAPGHPTWLDQIFSAKAARTGGIVRRSVRDVEREVGRDALLTEVARHNFHLVECAGQFIIICRPDHLIVHA